MTSSTQTLSTLLPAFRSALVADGRRPQGIDAYVRHVQRLMNHVGADAPPAALTPNVIAEYYERAASRWAPSHASQALSAIRALGRWCVRRGYLTADPTEGMRHPRRPDAVPRAPDDETRRAFWQALQMPDDLTEGQAWYWQRNRRAVMLMAYGGLRRAEAANLTWADVRLSEGVLMVRTGKGGKDRPVPIHPALFRELAATKPGRPTHAVAGQTDGRKLRLKSFSHIVERWLQDRGIEVSNHSLRHMCATGLLEASVDIRVIQEILGHEDLETTARYLRCSARHLKSGMDKLPEEF